MADKELNMENSPPTSDRGRSREHEPSGARSLERSRDHKSVQTEKVPVRHTGVQFESPTRQFSAPPSQTAGNCTNTQMSVPPFETVVNPADTQMSVLPSQTVENCANTQVVHPPSQTVANCADTQMVLPPSQTVANCANTQMVLPPSQIVANCADTQMVLPPSQTVANSEDTQMVLPPSQIVANCADTQVVLPPSQTVANSEDTQMTVASSVNVESSSGTQIGGGNSIVHNNNNTYKITNNTFNIFANVTQLSPSQLTDLIRSVEQAAGSGDQSSASYPDDVTSQIPNSNSIQKIKTVTSRTVTPNESQVPGSQVQTVTSQSNHQCSSDSDVQSQETGGMQSTQQDQTKSSEQRCQTKRKTPDSNSLNANPLSDVTNTGACRTAQGNVTDVKGQQATCSNGQNDSQQKPAGRRSAKSTPSTSIQDSVCIIDSKGRALEPGDVVWINNRLFGYRAIYIGHQQVVLCRYPGEFVEKRELNLTQPFGKVTIQSGECSVFPAPERVERSMSRVGTRFTETDGRGWWGRGSDFTFWVATGLDYDQAYSRGFRL